MPPLNYIYHHEFYVDAEKNYMHLVVTRESKLYNTIERFHLYGTQAILVYRAITEVGNTATVTKQYFDDPSIPKESCL